MNSNKRPYHDERDRGHAQKKQKQNHHGRQGNKHDRRDDRRDRDWDNKRGDRRDHTAPRQQQGAPSHADALAQLPPPTTTLGPVPAYTPFTTPAGLPPLPEIATDALRDAPFRHKSTTSGYNRSASTATAQDPDVTYEKLEFLGDAYLELLASRILYTRFPHITAGQQSQLRELLVKNETLSEYARAYAFDRQVHVGDLDRMVHDAKERGNKGFNKILGDVFEAYVAAVVLSHPDHGFLLVEKWMQALWAPKLLDAARKEKYLTPHLALTHSAADKLGAGDHPPPLETYNPAAKADLQKAVMGPGVKLAYEPYAASVELKGDQLGQNRHYIAVYLTGFGYERRLLGKGEGKNKVEAGNWAATDAMFGAARAVVEECAGKLAVVREQRRREKERAEGEEGEVGEGKTVGSSGKG